MREEQLTSPDGAIRVEFAVTTGRMSHEIYSPRVFHLPSGELLIDLWGTSWDASAQFDEPGTVRLDLRLYPGDRPGFGVTVDARARTFRFPDSPGQQYPLKRFNKLIGQKHARQKPYPTSRPGMTRGEMLLSLIAFLAALALIFWRYYF